jgi:hypothetical protein
MTEPMDAPRRKPPRTPQLSTYVSAIPRAVAPAAGAARTALENKFGYASPDEARRHWEGVVRSTLTQHGLSPKDAEVASIVAHSALPNRGAYQAAYTTREAHRAGMEGDEALRSTMASPYERERLQEAVYDVRGEDTSGQARADAERYALARSRWYNDREKYLEDAKAAGAPVEAFYPPEVATQGVVELGDTGGPTASGSYVLENPPTQSVWLGYSGGPDSKSGLAMSPEEARALEYVRGGRAVSPGESKARAPGSQVKTKMPKKMKQYVEEK